MKHYYGIQWHNGIRKQENARVWQFSSKKLRDEWIAERPDLDRQAVTVSEIRRLTRAAKGNQS